MDNQHMTKERVTEMYSKEGTMISFLEGIGRLSNQIEHYMGNASGNERNDDLKGKIIPFRQKMHV